MSTLAGALRPRLRGADGLCLSLLPPKPTCSNQARVWRSASAPAALEPPPKPERPPPTRLLPWNLPEQSATHPPATHIICAVITAANLAAMIDRESKKIKNRNCFSSMDTAGLLLRALHCRRRFSKFLEFIGRCRLTISHS